MKYHAASTDVLCCCFFAPKYYMYMYPIGVFIRCEKVMSKNIFRCNKVVTFLHMKC